MKQAIRPDWFNQFSLMKKDKEAEEKGASKEERALYTLSLTEGWEILEKYISQWKKELDELNNNAIAQGLSFEEIGKNTIIVNLAKGVIKNIEDKVNDAREQCEK